MNKHGKIKILAFSFIFFLQAFAFADDNFIFEIARQSLSKEADQNIIKNAEVLPFQNQLKKILGRSVFKDGKQFLLVELYFPEYAGVIQSSGFYDPSDDIGDWLEDLLIHLEEERIAEELNKMETELSEYNSEDPLAEAEEESEEYAEEEAVENDDVEEDVGSEDLESPELKEKSKDQKTPYADEINQFLESEHDGTNITDKNSELQIYQFQNEIFMRQNTANGNAVINSSGSRVVRNYYDDRMRIKTRETWNIKSIDAAKLEKSENFNYNGDSFQIVSKKTVKDDVVEYVSYSEKGLVESVKKYTVFKKKEYITLKRTCTYNEDGKVLSDESIEYTYNKNYKKQESEFSKKYEYEYNEGDIPPDFKYMENGIVKMHNKYSSEEGSYTSQVYFDEGFSVKTYYKNDLVAKEVYYFNGTVMREKVYETSEISVQ